MTRADVIADVLRRPVLRRPVLGHELRERLVQGLGPSSTVAEWVATVPQLAEAIDTALVAAAGHGLVVQHDGIDLVGTCQCGQRLGRIRPGTRLDALTVPWERHTAHLPALARTGA
ncbi:MAG: hypothetical protein HOV92_36970 [Streptomyces sp.]|nr:hypothetical protein [Streptomyces sp.]